MGTVTNSGCITKLDLPPDQVLEAALGKMSSVVIIGYDNEENEYFASSIAYGPEVVWLLERLKLKLLTVDDE